MKGSFLIAFSLFLQAAYGQEVHFTVSKDGWNADSLGNIRAVVEVRANGPVAKAVIPWRRSDIHPEDKRIIVQDGQTSRLIANAAAGSIGNESGEVYFEPVSGKGVYYIYYMPYKNEGRSNYPRGVYLSPIVSVWPHSDSPVMATVREIESIDAFNSIYPMEVIATAAEKAIIIRSSGQKEYLVFPEDRRYPIKMKDRLPARWATRPYQPRFDGIAAKGENYTYQLGVYALKDMNGMRVVFSDLRNLQGRVIPKGSMSCLNDGGIDYTGKPFLKSVSVPAGKIQALWCLTDVPGNIPAGIYKGTVTIRADGAAPTTIPIRLTVKDTVLGDGGVGSPENQTRLKWLNSTLMQDNTVISPYIPLQVSIPSPGAAASIALLGRKVFIGTDGMPTQIQTFFTAEMTGYSQTPNDLLTQPIHFIFTGADHHLLPFRDEGLRFTRKEAGTVEWTSTSRNAALQMDVSAKLEFDGYLQYQVKVTALQPIGLDDISMDIPFSGSMAKYMMGLGQKGGLCPNNFDWQWQVATKNQDGAWIGAVNAGLQFSLRDEKYSRPLNTNFYLQKPLVLPSSWGNGDKGGIRITGGDGSVTVQNFSGSRTMKKGDTLFYNVSFLITPFHPINTDFQWATRFYHRYNAIDSIKDAGATIVNIHHATPINPWINYPFIEYKKMKAYIDEAHAKGLKVKIYNTVRELSDHAYELFPMRSLGHEIYSPGKGGGFSWLQEHVKDDYIPAWFVPELKDAALINSGMSRWHNYYVEGMNWLVQNVGIDGIYLDDVAFDRVTMKRIKRVLTLDGHPGIIDLHSANQYNKNDGFNNSANLYMEHFPYLSRLWFGEYFDYEKNDPAFFLTEVSGIPFGLMGEMLQGGGNPWRGMVYGMTNRMPWSDNADP
ncbi:MAG TPA: glycoside hydrolase domain-containing protein, partial [Puia sp.]|nr:glycoside hydrolase domain-containing protein [Puia sp.]